MNSLFKRLRFWWKMKRSPEFRQRQRMARGRELWEDLLKTLPPNQPLIAKNQLMMNQFIRMLSKDEKEILQEYIKTRNSDIRRKKAISCGQSIWNDIEIDLKKIGVTDNDEVRFSFFERMLNKRSIVDKSDLAVWLTYHIKRIHFMFDEFDSATIQTMEENEKKFYQRHLDIVEKSLNESLK